MVRRQGGNGIKGFCLVVRRQGGNEDNGIKGFGLMVR